MKEFEVLTILRRDEISLLVYGAWWDTRSDGTGSYLLAQSFAVDTDCPEGTIFMEEDGTCWRLMNGISEGFHIDAIIFEEDNSATE